MHLLFDICDFPPVAAVFFNQSTFNSLAGMNHSATGQYRAMIDPQHQQKDFTSSCNNGLRLASGD